MEGSRERGRGRREETEGGFLLNTLTFISALQHTYAGFFGKVRALWFVHTRMLPLLTQTEKDTMNPLYFLHRGDTHKKSTAIPARLKNVLVASQGI